MHQSPGMGLYDLSLHCIIHCMYANLLQTGQNLEFCCLFFFFVISFLFLFFNDIFFYFVVLVTTQYINSF